MARGLRHDGNTYRPNKTITTLVPVDGVQYALLVNQTSITPYVVSSEDRGHTLRVSASWGNDDEKNGVLY